MATVFMKWLESSPKNYDRGIEILTLGRLSRIKENIAQDFVSQGDHVLEIGCGTGTLTAMIAKRGAKVTAIDASPPMLAEAKERILNENLKDTVSLKHMDAALIGERFPPGSFDLIVSTLVFSELPVDEQRYVLEACSKLLSPRGKLLIADEVLPTSTLSRLLYFLVRTPLALITWLLTRATTSPLKNFNTLLAQTNLEAHPVASYLGNSLVLYRILPTLAAQPSFELPSNLAGHLSHRTTLRTLLLDLWTLFFRIIPPYPKVRPGLYTVGHPDPNSPVLVTGNFDLTVRRLVAAIDGKVDAWILVADSAGINVWCAAGGGYFTADKVIAAITTSRIKDVVKHHALILPQLCANGVDGWRIRKETGWGVHWGPAKAKDIPAYLAAGRKKTDDMRWVRFPLKDRLEMVTVTLGFYGLLILVPVLIFWRSIFWPITASLLGLSYFYTIVHPWLPGRDGLYKSIPLTMITLIGFIGYSLVWPLSSSISAFHWGVGLTGLSVFVAAELQGMSPLMRGEQANWFWEGVIGAGLALTYWILPLTLGWR
jgi:ubiquinone/menaquinone biosynthesis C-methylase UbiE